MKTATLYSRIKPINKRFIVRLSLDTGQSIAACTDAVIDAIRLKRPVTLKPKINKALEKAEALDNKKRQKIKALK